MFAASASVKDAKWPLWSPGYRLLVNSTNAAEEPTVRIVSVLQNPAITLVRRSRHLDSSIALSRNTYVNMVLKVGAE